MSRECQRDVEKVQKLVWTRVCACFVTKKESSHVNVWERVSQKLEGLNVPIRPLTRREVVAEHVGGQGEAEEGNTRKCAITFARPLLEMVEERLNVVAVEALPVHPKPVDEFALLLALLCVCS